MKIVLLESLSISEAKLAELTAPLIAAGHSFTAYPRTDDLPTLIRQAQAADVLMLANMPLPGEVIRACPHLQFIDVAFTGTDHVDLKAAAEKGIRVSNASGYSNQAVAELVIGQMLSLLRHTHPLDRRTRQEGVKDGLVGYELGSRTVGVIGSGAIGQRVIQLLRAFGARVLAYDPFPRMLEGVENVSLEALLTQSDIVTLHCPLTESTRGLIDADALSLMPRQALLVNMSRGPVVDSAAVARALNEERIAGAAVDVFEMEPPIPANHPLLTAKNCLVTPHVAFATQESMVLRAEIVFASLKAWLDGKPIHVVL